MKLGKTGKNRLKIKEKAEILAKENFQKQGNQLRNSHTSAPKSIKHETSALESET